MQGVRWQCSRAQLLSLWCATAVLRVQGLPCWDAVWATCRDRWVCLGCVDCSTACCSTVSRCANTNTMQQSTCSTQHCAVNSCGRRWPSWSWSRAAQSSGYLGPGDMHPCSADSELSVWHSCTPCAFSAWDKRPVSTRGHVQTRAGTWWLHGRVRTCELRVSGAKQHLSP